MIRFYNISIFSFISFGGSGLACLTSSGEGILVETLLNSSSLKRFSTSAVLYNR